MLSKTRRRPPCENNHKGAMLQEGWVIANHILVSFHVAFISSVLALPAAEILRGEVLKFIFVSAETVVSAIFMYVTFHAGIALHELGHYLTAARLSALNDSSQEAAEPWLRGSFVTRALFVLKVFVLAPYGKAAGIKREGLNYYPDSPYNLAVAAAGPRMSRNVAFVALPPAVVLLAVGLMAELTAAVYVGRLCLGIGVVSLLDFLLADPGKYKEFKEREKRAEKKAAAVERGAAWLSLATVAREKILKSRMQAITHPKLGDVTAPWQFRNCGMGGRHTEKEYPESNVSMQEAMFLILGAKDYQEAQEMTVRLQNRLKEIIEKAEGCRVMGIGLEGGLAPYIERGTYPLPEVRLWAMMKQTIQECGYRPGVDVAIALDPAMSELEIAYRKEFNIPDAVGMYLFWRDKAQTVMDRDGILELYVQAIEQYDIPILSIEDGYSENDFEGWKNLLDKLGDRILVIGDDLVTTNDATIELASAQGLINTALIKANQIGSLYETIIAMLVALGKGMELVVSHRSKSPNDDMEAQIALAVNSLGLKAGGGANTERLVKYHAVTELMQRGVRADDGAAIAPDQRALIDGMYAYEEPTNAGVPTVGAAVELRLPDAGVSLKFSGATPLGTSAGTGEAIHLVDGVFERAEYREVVDGHPSLFREVEAGVHAFAKDISEEKIKATGDEALTRLYARSQRYEGKGCLNAVDNVRNFIEPAFAARPASALSIKDIDRTLLALELHVAHRRGKIGEAADVDEQIKLMQRKQNIGMNAMLSVSLALARGAAHLQGKDLYEILREEIYAIVTRLAREHDVAITGSQFSDYVDALRKVNATLEEHGTPLYEVLREQTGIYPRSDEILKADAPVAPARATESDASSAWPPTSDPAPDPAPPSPDPEVPPASPPARDADRPAASAGTETVPAGAAAPAPGEAAATAVSVATGVALTAEEQAQLDAVSRALYSACHDRTDLASSRHALLEYQRLRESLQPRAGQFHIVNSRVFLSGQTLFVPYLIGHTLRVEEVGAEAAQTCFEGLVPLGTILTDDTVQSRGGFSGGAVDLEPELMGLEADDVDDVSVNRIRDMVEHLRRINRSVNRNEIVFTLRNLVARLSLFSLRSHLGAKNIQSEVHGVTQELIAFVNTVTSERSPFLLRMLVRNITSIVSKPKLIDQLWHDTIDLAEVHVRGSDIVNELRRSSHHAIGRHTLSLAQAYHRYLETGDTAALTEAGYPLVGPADEAARSRTHPKEILERIIRNLEDLLGTSETVSRIREWQDEYSETLIRCEFGRTLYDEVDAAIAGAGATNRWTYYHHLRLIHGRVAEFAPALPDARGAVDRIDALLALKPDEPEFDVDATARELRECVDGFVAASRAAFETDLFTALEGFLDRYQRREYYNTFVATSQLRIRLRETLRQRAFPEQRLLLYQLDCLLEEMGWLALRHVAAEYEERGADFGQCLEIIHTCVFDLTHDGLYSRQLRDLAEILRDPTKTYAEVRDVLTQIQRNYQHVTHRVITPFERMQQTLGFDDTELRIAIANMQRYMHDLNNVAGFIDIALGYVKHQVKDADAPVGRAEDATAPDPFAILHLSHRPEVVARVKEDGAGRNLRDCYGGKGSGLIYISYLGLPTRDAFIIPTTFARQGMPDDSGQFHGEVTRHLRILEADVARRDGVPKVFGNPERPLLLAVRGGSVFSMPGMLSTVVYVGMNDAVAEQMANDDPWCAYDSLRRFLASYGEAVWGVDMERYNLVDETKRRYDVRYKEELPWEGMKEIADATKAILVREGHGEALEAILAEPEEQLLPAVRAVIDSWNGENARRYREIKSVCDSWQTAVIVQEMALGNRRNDEVTKPMDESVASLTGVIPRTLINEIGLRIPTGDFKFSAHGDDLVAGLTRSISFLPLEALSDYMPMLNRNLSDGVGALRRFMGTDQEVEFTVERGVLSLLQSRAAEIGVNRRLAAFSDTSGEAGHGVGVRGGAFRGLVAFDEAGLLELKAQDLSGRDDVDGIIALMQNPSPDEIPLLLQADGLLAAKGGSTSHAAIAANGIEHRDYTAVVGVEGLRVNARKREAEFINGDGDVVARLGPGDVVSIHGTSGAVYVGSREVTSH